MCWNCNLCNIRHLAEQDLCFLCGSKPSDQDTVWQCSSKWAKKQEYWWTCTICNHVNVKIHARSCQSCGNTRQEYDENNMIVKVKDDLVTFDHSETATTWSCSACTFKNSGRNVFCLMCTKPSVDDCETIGAWSCRKCTFRNPINNDSCSMCTEPKHPVRNLECASTQKKSFELVWCKDLLLLTQGYARTNTKNVRMQIAFQALALVAKFIGNNFSKKIKLSAKWGTQRNCLFTGMIKLYLKELNVTIAMEIILCKVKKNINLSFYINDLPSEMISADLIFYFEVPELYQRQSVYGVTINTADCGMTQTLDEHFLYAEWIKDGISLLTRVENSNVMTMKTSSIHYLHTVDCQDILEKQILIKQTIKQRITVSEAPDNFLKFIGHSELLALWLVNGTSQWYELRLVKLPWNLEDITCNIFSINEKTKQKTLALKKVKFTRKSRVINLLRVQYRSKDWFDNSKISTVNVNILLHIESLTRRC